MANKLFTFPLPRRARVTTDAGYTTRPWTLEDVIHALSVPEAWFERGKHEFDCAATAEFALKQSEVRGA